MLHHLTFGRNIQRKGGNDYVTDLDWQMYCEEVLDSYFDGYTITDADGCWKSVHEKTKQVSIETEDRQAINDVFDQAPTSMTNEQTLATLLLNPELGEYTTKVTAYTPTGDTITFE